MYIIRISKYISTQRTSAFVAGTKPFVLEEKKKRNRKREMEKNEKNNIKRSANSN